MANIRPANPIELQFNHLASNKLFEIAEEINTKDFWNKSPEYRFCKYTKLYSLFSELTNYHSFKEFIKQNYETSIINEIKVQSKFYNFIRHIFAHFPYFEKWDEVWITKEIISWDKDRTKQNIHKFIEEYVGNTPMKFRFTSNESDEYTEVILNFPQSFNENERIYLKDFINEKDGVLFSIAAMNNMMRDLNYHTITE